jgi:hypothetical protein
VVSRKAESGEGFDLIWVSTKMLRLRRWETLTRIQRKDEKCQEILSAHRFKFPKKPSNFWKAVNFLEMSGWKVSGG